MAPADSTAEVQCFGILALLLDMLLGFTEQKESADKYLKDKERRAKEHRPQPQLELARAGSLSTDITATSGQSHQNKWQRAVQKLQKVPQLVRKKFDEEREALRLSPKMEVQSKRKLKATTLPTLARVVSQEGHGLSRAGSLKSQGSSIRSEQCGLLRSSTMQSVELITAGSRKVRNDVRRLRSNIERSLAPKRA